MKMTWRCFAKKAEEPEFPKIVSGFFDKIVLPTKNEFAGSPGKDYDGKYYRPGFVESNKIERYDGNDGLLGYVSPLDWNNVVHLKDRSKDVAAVHELTHNQNRDAPFFLNPFIRAGSGRSDEENKKLRDAYRFDSVAHGKNPFDPDAEAGATNREYRYRIYKELSGKLGRIPTYDEFKEYVRNMQPERVNEIFYENRNGYVDDEQRDSGNVLRDQMQEHTYDPNDEIRRRQRLEAIRRAWLEVAKSRKVNLSWRSFA